MADRWMDERDRRWRERDWRRSEEYGRGELGEGRYLSGEARSWGGSAEEGRGYGRGEGRLAGGRASAYRGGASAQGGHGGWQDRDYGGVSPAMRQGEYAAEREAERYGQGGFGQSAGYGQGGRYYGDAGRERIYRQEYGQGGVEYGDVPRGYDFEREEWMEHRRGRFEGDRDRGMAGYGDYERGYGYGGRQRYAEGRFGAQRDEGRFQPRERGERWERGAREAGDFVRRAGERVASWFGGGEAERDFRGMGPKGYKRADERISDEVHERLTDDPWIDASNISVSVSGGEVTLAGAVEHREAKHRAERVVEDIAGVSHVQNNLRVDRGGFLTRPASGYGDSATEHQMRGETGAAGSSRSSGSADGDTGKPQ